MLAWLCLCVFPRHSNAQTNGPGLTYPKNRYLLIVETSRAMQRRADSMIQAVHELITSALGAQARPGDTLGVWTFNENLHAGGLPLQQWAPGSQNTIAARVVGFLKGQKYEKSSRFDKIVPAVNRLAGNSQFITIVLVCSGEADIHGTPFDRRINEFFRSWRQQPQDSGRPFIIALRAQSGNFVDCAMNPSPWPPELPALPKELLTPIATVQPALVEAPKPATSSVPPLIIVGKKREVTTPITEPALPKVQAAVPSSSATSAVTTPVGVASAPPMPGSTGPQPPVDVTSSSSTATTSSVQHLSGLDSDAPSAISRVAPSSKPGSVPVSQEPEAISKPQRETTATPLPMTDRPPIQVPVAVPVDRSVYHATLAFMGLISILAVAGALWFWRARARQTHETSLITESFDRHRDG